MPSRLIEPGESYLRPTPSQREILSVPLGDLVGGRPEEAVQILRERYLSNSNGISFSVGDVVTRALIERGVPFQVAVIDLRIQRRKADFEMGHFGRKFLLRNPAGHINIEAWSVLRAAMSAGPNSLVLVDGEEDLLAAVAIDVGGEGTLVIYGQPAKGMVVIRIQPDIRKRIRELVASFPRISGTFQQKP